MIRSCRNPLRISERPNGSGKKVVRVPAVGAAVSPLFLCTDQADVLARGLWGLLCPGLQRFVFHPFSSAHQQACFLILWGRLFMEPDATAVHIRRKPPWLTKRLPPATLREEVRRLLRDGGVHTVCEEARCPNLAECFSRRTATFLILGDRCTRNCRFCAIRRDAPDPPDPEEPERVAEAARRLNLRYVVVTSVTRDDLSDGGSGHFAETIRRIRAKLPSARVEVLIPDFQGSEKALADVIETRPDVLNHNLETVDRLYPEVRPKAEYRRSLGVIARARRLDPGIITKSGLMLGLGEGEDELRKSLDDLLDAGCRILTLGQYLRPSRDHHPVRRYVPPAEFAEWERYALKTGFLGAACGPFVRSSYRAGELFQAAPRR